MPVIDDGRLTETAEPKPVQPVNHVTDSALEASIRRMLWRCAFVAPDYQIRVTARGGIVSLEGTCMEEADVRVIGEIIRSLDGVTKLENRLSARGGGSKRR